jgi:hypothetical protein
MKSMVSIAALVVGLALASSSTNAATAFGSGAFAIRSSLETATLVKQAVLVVRRRAPVARCAVVRGRRVC